VTDVLEAWKGVTCVVMCGGRGSRFAAAGRHKSMTCVNGEPLLGHVVDYWRTYAASFLFVVKNGKDEVMDYVAGLPVDAAFVEPPHLGGIAHGLSCVEGRVEGPFIVVLGDCFVAGTFHPRTPFSSGIGVQRGARPEAIRRNYAVFTEGERVVRVEEKPQQVANDLCGMGFYFFQPDVFGHIRATRPSARTGELEITDVLQTMVDRGVDLRAALFDGTYVNVNTPDDLTAIAAALPPAVSAAAPASMG
jgi:glucose-1-phosphate thymidylyltransferase